MQRTLCACYQLPVAVEVHKAPVKNSEGDGGKLSMGYSCRTLLESEINQKQDTWWPNTSRLDLSNVAYASTNGNMVLKVFCT